MVVPRLNTALDRYTLIYLSKLTISNFPNRLNIQDHKVSVDGFYVNDDIK